MKTVNNQPEIWQKLKTIKMKEEYLKVSRYSDLEDPKERFIYRALEIFPELSWSIIILSIIAAILFPLLPPDS